MARNIKATDRALRLLAAAILLVVCFYQPALAHRIYSNQLSELSEAEINALNQKLKKRAEGFCEVFQKRLFREVYKYINPRYRKEVSEDWYVDFIEYPGYTDGHFKVKVLNTAVLPTGRHGKVVIMITLYSYKRELINEKIENQDWIYEKDEWYKVEKLM